jgi:multiple sugar transport system substrate-binding protein
MRASRRFAILMLAAALLLLPASGALAALVEGEGYSGVRKILSEDGSTVLLELEPDELFIFVTNNKIMEKSQAARERLLGQYIRERFPDLKFRIVVWDDMGIREKNFEISGVYPDMVLELIDRNTTRTIKTYGMDYDLTPLIEKYNFDLSRIDEASMAIVYDRSTGGVLSIPFEINDYILFYNKAIFDKKNEPYPYAGMTYDEAYEKTQRLTFAEEVGDKIMSYKGYQQHPDQYMKLNQLGLIPFSLTERDKVVLDTPEWLQVVENMSRFYDIPGNVWNKTDDFWQKGSVAMAVDHIERLLQVAMVEDYWPANEREQWLKWQMDAGVLGNWDIAPIPVMFEGDDTIYRPNVNGWFIPKQSQMKETAFQVIMHLLSDEVQMGRAKDGMKGVVNTPEIAAAYGTNLPELQGLNLSAVYWGKGAVQPVRSPEVAGGGYWDIALWKVYRLYIIQQGYTPEIALKRVEQEENQWIQERIAEGREF